MAISFNQISSTNRVPGPQLEVDGSKAVALQPGEPQRVLIIGLRLTAGTVAQAITKRITGETDGDAFFGAASQLANMARAFKRVNKSADLYAMALDENAGGTAATCTFPLVGTASADGTLRVRIGDQRVTLRVASGTAANTALATALAAAINATDRCMFSAAASLGTVTCTCRHKGEVGNGYTIEVESLPAGITCTPTQPTNGATNPAMSTAIAAIDEGQYDTIVTGLTDATSMAALEVEAARRWGPTVKKPSGVIAGVRGSHGTLTTYGAARNSAYSCVIGSGLSPTPPHIWAAQAAARDAQMCDVQPNRPRNGMTLPDCEAPKLEDRFDHDERNLLLFDGVSTFNVDQSGMVTIERLISTYQTNTLGLQDVTYLSWETIRNLAGMYREFLNVGARFNSHVLVPDGTKVSPGVKHVSPKMFRGELVDLYESLVSRGRAKNQAEFERDLICEINAIDGERLDVQLPPWLANPLVTIAMQLQFRL